MRILAVAIIVNYGFLLSAGCQKEDPRLTEMNAKLDKIDKRLDELAKRQPAAAAPAPRKGADPSTVYNLPVVETDITHGAQAAKVTIVEGSDFACPYCAQARPALEEAVAKHPSEVRVVSKQFIIHTQVATLPALAVCAAQKQGMGLALENAIWAEAWTVQNGRPSFDQSKLSQESIETVAAAQKLDVKRLSADMKGQPCLDEIARQRRELSSVGVNSTPAFYINGRPYLGARTAQGFEAAIEEEIKKADAAIQGGTKIEDYYSTLMKSAAKSI